MSPENNDHLAPSPAPPDRTDQFNAHLRRYLDRELFDLDKLPIDWPTTFHPKTGEMIVGIVVMDWKALLQKLIKSAIALSIPQGLSDQELDKLVHAFKNQTSEEKKQEILDGLMWPAMSTIIYMWEHLPEKIDEAVALLAAEGRYAVQAIAAKDKGKILDETPAELAKVIAMRTAASAKDRLSGTKERRGQRSKWTAITFHESLKAAARSLKLKDKEKPPSKQIKRLDYNDICRELLLLYPETAPSSGETTRKLISRLHLNREWREIKETWDTLANSTIPAGK